MTKTLPPSLFRIRLNHLNVNEKRAAFIVLNRFGEWQDVSVYHRFDYPKRVRRDLFLAFGTEEAVTALLSSPVGTIFEECVSFVVLTPEFTMARKEVVPCAAAERTDVRRLLWSVFVRLGYRAQKDFAKAIGVDQAVITRVFQALSVTQSPGTADDTKATGAGITIDRLNGALARAGVIPRMDQISVIDSANPAADQTSSKGIETLTVRERHLVKLAGFVARLAERSSPHSLYQFVEHYNSLVQCATESLCWLEATTGPLNSINPATLIDTAFDLVCHSLGSTPGISRTDNSTIGRLSGHAAVFGLGPEFCPTIGISADVHHRWHDVLADRISPSGQIVTESSTATNTQHYSQFARAWCLHRASVSLTDDAMNLADITGLFDGASLLGSAIQSTIGQLDIPSEQLYKKLKAYWKQNTDKSKERENPELVESLFWRFIWEVTPAIQTCSYGGVFSEWQRALGKKYLEELTSINQEMKDLCGRIAGYTGSASATEAMIADFNELDCRFHLTLASGFKVSGEGQLTTPERPTNDRSLLRRLFANTTLMRSTRRHADDHGRRCIVLEHDTIVGSIRSLLSETNVPGEVHYPATLRLREFVAALYRHLFSAPQHETGKTDAPFINSLARLVSQLPEIDTYADMRSQWENCRTMVVAVQGTLPLELVMASDAPESSNSTLVFAAIAVSLFNAELTSSESAVHSIENAESADGKLVLLVGDQPSYDRSVSLLRKPAVVPHDSFTAYWTDFSRRLRSLKNRLVRICEMALENNRESPVVRDSFAQLSEGLHRIKLSRQRASNQTIVNWIRRELEHRILVQTVAFPELAVWAGECKAISWPASGTSPTFTYRQRNSETVYNLGDNNNDDRNCRVIQIVRSVLHEHVTESSSVLKSLRKMCDGWLLNDHSAGDRMANENKRGKAKEPQKPEHGVV